MKHIGEEDLIAYQLREGGDAGAIRRHLEVCVECRSLAESIAETLRVFSAEPVPHADPDHVWQRLRGVLPPLAASPPRRAEFFAEPFIGLFDGAKARLAAFALAILLPVAYLSLHRAHRAGQGSAKPSLRFVRGRSGPLTEQARDPEIAAHLESAERLLTEINHSSGALNPATQRQAHALLLSNALAVRRAHDDGDLAQALVLEDLGRTLITLDRDQPERAGSLGMRLELNTAGLLFDIRILQQNDNGSTRKEP